MILVDFECACGRVEEYLVDSSVTKWKCSCGKIAKKIISSSGVYLSNQDSPWVRTVLDVVDRDNPARHVQEFIKHPNRSSYNNWMKGEKLRPADRGEKVVRWDIDPSRHAELIMKKKMKADRIEIVR